MGAHGFADPKEAFAAARVLVDACAPADSRLDVVGDFAVLATMTIGGPIILWRARLRQTNKTRDAS